MYTQLKEQFTSINPPRSLYPLLWLHGDPRETEEVIRREIAAMDEGGCAGFIIESRPHNDYLGERWWRDVAICLDEANRRGMEVWIFDEEYYPSGIAGGKVLGMNPDYRMRVLVRESYRWNSLMDILTTDMERVLKVICHAVDNLSGHQHIFYSWEQFEEWQNDRKLAANRSEWILTMIGLKPSWSGRMSEKMVDYLNPEVTDAFISITYEATKQKFGKYFGSTIKGFFSDETSFENFGSYDCLFGPETPCMPWTSCLLESFEKDTGYDLLSCIEALWIDTGEETSKIRYDFMNVMTSLFSNHFFARIQAWCHQNGLKFIGHVVEDNNAHMHHGYGPGHFFRSTKHFDFGGYDFVLRQVDSEQNLRPYQEHYPQFKSYRDAPQPHFFHFTLAKLAQSAAHLELQSDIVMCENFGAYGWDLGVREMKWLTDWQTARGTNWYVPHAFSPIFPDPDCPPHFYAGGHNPQWTYFRQWADYANRSCLMLRDGIHVASILVLYPAESHWAGDDVGLDRVTRLLTEHQLDFDIISADLLVDEHRCLIERGMIAIGNERFTHVILPGVETIPLAALRRLEQFIGSGGKVIAAEKALTKECSGDHASIKTMMLDLSEQLPTVALADLIDVLEQTVVRSIRTTRPFPDLRYTHHRKEEVEIFFLFNEGMELVFEDIVTFHAEGTPQFWFPMNGEVKNALVYEGLEHETAIPIRLQPYQSLFIVFSKETSGGPRLSLQQLTDNMLYTIDQDESNQLFWTAYQETIPIPKENWLITEAKTLLPDTYPEGCLYPGLGDWGSVPEWETFAGSMTYETIMEFDGDPKDQYVLNLGQVGEVAVVYVNDVAMTPLLCPPYRLVLPQKQLDRKTSIRVIVTNTLGSFLREETCKRDIPAPSGLIGPVTVERYLRRRLS